MSNLTRAHAHGSPALGGAALGYVFQSQMAKKFRQGLSSASAGELLRRPGAVRLDLSRVRSLKTNALRLLIVREGHEDLKFSILVSRGAVDTAMGAAYPSVFARDD